MRKILWLTFICFVALELRAQTFEVGEVQEVYRGFIGETVKVPLSFTNTTDRPLTLVVRRVKASLGGTQRNYFCPKNDCLDQNVEDVLVRLDPKASIDDLSIALDAGLASGISTVKYLVFNRYNSSDSMEFEVNFSVEERSAKLDIFTHPQIILHDVYPNPVVDYAYVNYNLLNSETEAKIVIHNILGNPIEEYNLPASENKVKIRAESMNAGIYFYTLYLDNEGVVTRKLIVKK